MTIIITIIINITNYNNNNNNELSSYPIHGKDELL